MNTPPAITAETKVNDDGTTTVSIRVPDMSRYFTHELGDGKEVVMGLFGMRYSFPIPKHRKMVKASFTCTLDDGGHSTYTWYADLKACEHAATAMLHQTVNKPPSATPSVKS